MRISFIFALSLMADSIGSLLGAIYKFNDYEWNQSCGPGEETSLGRIVIFERNCSLGY